MYLRTLCWYTSYYLDSEHLSDSGHARTRHPATAQCTFHMEDNVWVADQHPFQPPPAADTISKKSTCDHDLSATALSSHGAGLYPTSVHHPAHCTISQTLGKQDCIVHSHHRQSDEPH